MTTLILKIVTILVAPLVLLPVVFVLTIRPALEFYIILGDFRKHVRTLRAVCWVLIFAIPIIQLYLEVK